jgi:ribosome biogenesis protein SSF1/2
LRIALAPIGPTLTFQLKSFSLSKHVRAVQRRPYNSPRALSHPPIVVTNNFGDASASAHVKLLRITFQGMFPAINVETVQLSNCRRVVLFNFIQSTSGSDEKRGDEVEVRHYAIRASPVGVHRRVRRLIEAKIPNLSKLQDISDYITGTTASGDPAGVMSDSEPEDESTHVVLPQNFAGRGNSKAQKSALKLVELGPRLCLRLMKVEKELGSGEVMYHAYVTKSESEIQEKESEIKAASELKKRRREEQEANVARKTAALEEKKQAKKRRLEEKGSQTMNSLDE